MLPDRCSVDSTQRAAYVTDAVAAADMPLTSQRLGQSLTVSPYHVTTLMTSSQHARARQNSVVLTSSRQR